jgi:hypothetical protein
MVPEPSLNSPQQLQLYQVPKRIAGELVEPPRTPNSWFVARYPAAYRLHGSPFMELTQQVDQFQPNVLPVTINTDFMACALGGRQDYGHHVVYFEPELAWYYMESDGIYRITTSEKLAHQYRALMMQCAQDMPANIHKLNLVNEWRSDKTAKTIVQRAKSILAANSSFFSATSPHQRIKGPELHERLIRKLVETMLEPCQDSILTMTQAYNAFCRLVQQSQLGPMKRSMFKITMRDLVAQQFGLGLRRDVPDSQNKQQEAWKGVRLLECETLAA